MSPAPRPSTRYSDRLRRRSRSGAARWLWALLLGALVQVPAVGGFLWMLGREPAERPKVERRQSRIQFRPTKPPELVAPPEVAAPLPEDAVVVEVPDLDKPEPRETVDTRYLADKSVKVPKETKSKQKAAPDRAKAPGRVTPSKRSKVQSRRSSSEAPTETPSDTPQELAMAEPKVERPLADRGQKKPDTVLRDGQHAKLLLPSTSTKAQIANIQALSGSFATDDYLPDVTERADSTILNANKYRFADFFYRVKAALRRHWKPGEEYSRRDPEGRVYGVKDRHTLYHVTLDGDGNLKRLRLVKHSGLGFLDDEAKRALWAAQPFRNPPSGLVDDAGEVKFQFGFYFEIGSGRSRFRWKRL